MYKNKKIEVISFVAMICVVWWHCYCGSQVERWFIPGFCVWSVPWFFFLSGVLFRRTLDSKQYATIVVSKIRSLLVPYIIWCGIGAVVTSYIYVGGGWLDAFGISSIKIHPWGNNALWYVRSLLIFMMVTMFIDFFNKKLLGNQRVIGLIITLIVILMTSHFLLNLGPSSSSFYFAIGMISSEKVLGYKAVSKRQSVFVGFCFMLMAAVLRIVWFGIGHDFVNSGGTVLANMSVCAFLVGLWYWADLIPKKSGWSGTVLQLLSLTAFVYFMHYPINDFIKHHLHIQSLNYRFVSLCVFAPLLYLLFAWMVKKWFNKFYVILSGGR